jgi:hypothetical protein
LATPTIPDWPAYSDDDLVSDNGTDITSDFLDALGNAIQNSITGTDNPSVYASEIIDEVIQARGVYADLDERLDQPVVGTINTGESAADIVDEIVTARDDNPDLNDRLDNFVADEIPDAEGAVRGLVADDAQEWDGEKTFTTQPLVRPGTATSTTARVGGVLEADAVAHASTTSEEDATSFTLAPNSLSENGKGIRVHAWGKTASGASTRTIKLYWDGELLISFTTAVASGIYDLTADIIRVSAGVQTAVVSAGKLAAGLNTVTGVAIGRLHAVWDSAAAGSEMDADETGSIIVKTTIQDSAGANLTQLGCTIELIG